ncbi:MAG: hypothetical protein PHH17_01775 [Candidatus Pacebacteria bacterium]|nr:hypothetical protein [Candidatus Paceibacterota bacterium]MDD3072712.1 hypothetical protein [Candidatus Paceibacterota bacterium]MDD3729085.1 hypothetical protein [Candidatus Paceibacterota bacterium]MDD3729090.1 hypothetical protein [Candidatus Paceibacterota bacterium]MDD5445920.1 hypothetical protein [Candidatus Paceibacterota bacterium]
MSKCKAILDGDKITEIQVKTKAQEESQPQDKPEPKSSDKSEVQAPHTTQQSE